jgi:hypothetical protein
MEKSGVRSDKEEMPVELLKMLRCHPEERIGM